ncbi:hypothetical protein AMECASPLE_023682 [Ameca splendens]|uniref:Uncharacterized protein n=1 Tax=Ameca splendens TaxID=208324 RepID=A0ABV0Z2S7_9TELE
MCGILLYNANILPQHTLHSILPTPTPPSPSVPLMPLEYFCKIKNKKSWRRTQAWCYTTELCVCVAMKTVIAKMLHKHVRGNINEVCRMGRECCFQLVCQSFCETLKVP